MDKVLWDFEIQMDHFIPARRPDLMLINQKKQQQKKQKIKQKDKQILGPC